MVFFVVGQEREMVIFPLHPRSEKIELKLQHAPVSICTENYMCKALGAYGFWLAVSPAMLFVRGAIKKGDLI